MTVTLKKNKAAYKVPHVRIRYKGKISVPLALADQVIGTEFICSNGIATNMPLRDIEKEVADDLAIKLESSGLKFLCQREYYEGSDADFEVSVLSKEEK